MKPRFKLFKVLFLFMAMLPMMLSGQSSKQVKPVNWLDGVPNNVFVGMNLSDFEEIMGDKVSLEEEQSFRLVYLQEGSKDVINIIYYFDNEGNKPLYEIIVEFNKKKMAKAKGRELFGKPNHEGKEWLLQNYPYPPIWAWTFKNNLVVAAKIPNTEWVEDWPK